MGAYDHFIGELWPGAYGWLPLDNNPGAPNGPATIEPPVSEVRDQPAFACHVMANPTIPLGGADALLTSTGAPISDSMLSNVDHREELGKQYKSAPKPPKWDEEAHNRRQFRP